MKFDDLIVGEYYRLGTEDKFSKESFRVGKLNDQYIGISAVGGINCYDHRGKDVVRIDQDGNKVKLTLKELKPGQRFKFKYQLGYISNIYTACKIYGDESIYSMSEDFLIFNDFQGKEVELV